MSHLPLKIVGFTFYLSLVSLSCSSGDKSRNNADPVSENDPNSDSPNYAESEDETVIVVEPVNVEENDAVQIEASNRKTQMNIVFKASDTFQEGRYLSEHLVIIQANEESCFKLEVLSDVETFESANPEGSEQGVGDSGFCRGEQAASENQEPEDQDEGDQNEGDQNEGDQNEGDQNEDDQDSATLTLMSQTPDLCHKRLFRMKTKAPDEFGDPFNLESVVNKSAWLVYKTDNINVWSDAELGNPCFGGSPANMGKTPLVMSQLFNIRLGLPFDYEGSQDQVVLEHYKNIGDEASKIYSRLTSKFGPVSDVNANGAVDIFITPEINRLKFDNKISPNHDNFNSDLIIKPEDLAPFDVKDNPTSNESEVVYLWANDPAGLYKYSAYPTANSLTSNYQKGYLAQQIMTLIMNNAKLVSRQLQPEETWLVQGLSLLASAYMAGNDYSFVYLADYLSTRHHYLSLTDSYGLEQVAEGFKSRLRTATIGYRAMFAWFIHAKLCGESVQACDRIRELIDTDKYGIENIEAVLGKPINELITEFGHSVGIEMTENKDQLKDRLRSGKNGASILFQSMPGLQEVYPDEVPQTYEQDRNAEYVGGSNDDRAFAGPFPGRDTMFFQAVSPENSINLRLAKNSVTYLIVTGFLRKETVATAFIGKNVSLTSLPLGDRDSGNRQIYFEKTSEMAHIDQRPTNLTDQVDSNRTYYTNPESSQSFEVDKNRDVWILGSIDNYEVNFSQGDTSEKYIVGDVDSFNIKLDPCKGEDDEAACRSGGNKTILVQVVPRDFEKELTPGLLVTQTSLEMFQGARFLSRAGKLDDESFEDKVEPKVEHITCLSPLAHQTSDTIDFTDISKCANGGLKQSDYQLEVCDQFPEACMSGMPDQAVSFNAYTSAFIKKGLPEFFPAMYDNFFHSGPQGFPFLNNATIRFLEKNPNQRGPRPFNNQEIFRQFLYFGYDVDLKPTEYQFHPIFAGLNDLKKINLDYEISTMSYEMITALVGLKTAIEDSTTLSSSAFEDCKALRFPMSICEDAYNQREQLTTLAKELTAELRVTCTTNLDSVSSMDDIYLRCPGTELFRNTGVSGIDASVEVLPPWMDQDRFIVIHSGTSASYRTYYSPTFPLSSDAKSHCLGNDLHTSVSNGGTLGEDFPPCIIEKPESQAADIRAQLNMPDEMFLASGCDGQEFAEDFLACGGPYGYYVEIKEDDDYELVPTINKVRLDGERTRSFTPFYIANSAGEYIGKQGQLDYVSFEVPADAPTMIHVIVGGLKKSQGKYFLRIKSKPLNLSL